ncbi:MFS multidrug transporter-like protein [Polyplosphaeria fusca]|uniref:MFS multidrug transporter-like protein n=1 Tax=Polyplosphaeria fusca TaxID=682080 RepID=A0A9P4QKZ7_9PLEO|nr:MFS multidrug transporter-like protein [Polyplosphaeria fusca]
MSSTDAEKIQASSIQEETDLAQTPEDDDTPEQKYVTGWKLRVICIGLLVSLYIGQLETTITSSAVLDITNHLGGYAKSPWIFTAYLLTYCGLQMIWAKLSDIIGRKISFLTALAIFVVFSACCGASQTLIQLIMFRWCQGIGGSGVFILTQVVFFELMPPEKWPQNLSLVSAIIAFSMVCGPLVGGALSNHGQWRWIFLLNVPIGASMFVLLLLFFPKRLWNEPATAAPKENKMLSSKSLRRVDVLGSALLLGGCILVATGLQQHILGYAWKSSMVLALLIFAAILLISFLTWQWFVTTKRTFPEPVFPWRFCQNRVSLGMCINTYLVGTVLMVFIVQIPQKFMTVHGLSPFSAAVRLLAFGAFIPAGTTLAGALLKARVPPCYIMVVAIIMELIGTVLLYTRPHHTNITADQYGFQILIGTGLGFMNAALILMVPYVMEKRDLAAGSSAISQLRSLGGLIGVAIAASISLPYVSSHLAQVIRPELAAAILERTDAIRLLSGSELEAVRQIFADSYRLQVKLLIGFVVAQVPVTALMWTPIIAAGQ